ncbi:TonB-dependent receptor [Luteibacter aegosomaticola]|uniref:TonB-dependent receptor n=1 Tax=Luteibacter aegosomaticola TaxID=2911538 RepID=UPI001FF84B04|nr:TonB-dependent receptor [Luteibacter aegosomaticola]UPG88031.1 TonB-dependent receptor [Luteibacter aegosomaticola]
MGSNAFAQQAPAPADPPAKSEKDKAEKDKAVQMKALSVVANRYEATSIRMDSVNTVDVLSAKDLQNTAVHNVAEALGLMSGVNVTTTGTGYFGGIDGAARGEGMFASVRGLPSEYNVNLVNGSNVAQGMPYSRSVQLSLLPPSGLQTIVLNKTSTADMDGDAIGGTIDFRTPSAFDFKKDFSGSVTASGRVESRARDYGGSGLGSGLAGELQKKFGEEKQFGFYISGYYDYRNIANSEIGAAESASNDGSWAFLHANADGSSAAGYDPQHNLTSIGTNVGIASGFERRYGGNMSFDWNVDPTLHAYAKASYAYALTEQNTTYNQLLPQDVTYVPSATPGVYTPNIGRIANRFWFETNPERADLATIQLGADKTAGGWTISPNVFWSIGRNDRPEHVEIDGREDKYSQDNFAYNQSSLLSYGGSHFPYPVLTPALLNSVNNIQNMYANDYGEVTKIRSGQKRGGAKLDLRYDFEDGPVQNVKFGVKYSDSSREFTNRDWSTAGINDGTTTLGDLGIFKGDYSQIFPGKYPWVTPDVSRAAVAALIAGHVQPSDLDTCSQLDYNNFNCDTMRGTEAVSAAYAMATIQEGPLEIIPGVRFEHTSIHNTFWTTPQDPDGNELPGYFSNNHTVYNEPLGSLFINYRPGGNVVFRGSIWQSYTRPAFVQLGGGEQISVSNGVTTITRGNPNLDPIKATNVDLGAEWTTDQGGFFSLTSYYKKLKDYIYDSGGGQANPNTSGVGTVLTKTPTNGGDGSVYGIEATVRQKFENLPGAWNGLGFSVNATKQNSRVDLGRDGFENERLQQAPRTMANAELFYEKYGFSLNLSYHYTGSYISTYDFLNQGAPWDDLWLRPIRRVDLHAGYQMDNGLQFDLQISNLTKQYQYWSHIGRYSLVNSDIVDAGRTALVTVKYSF